MATIPVSTGRRVVRGGPLPAIPPAEGGVYLGRALQRFGQVGMDIATNDAAQIADTQARAVDSLQRSQAALALGEGKLALRTEARRLTERIVAGDVSEQQASEAWQGVRSSVLEQTTGNLSPDHKQQLANQLILHADELQANDIHQAFTVRRRDETRANVLQSLELFEREALDDRPRALAVAEQTLAKLGPDAGLGPDDQFKALQGLRERTAYNMGDRLTLQAGKNVHALDALATRINGDEFADLSPEARQRLEVKISNRRAQAQHDIDIAQRKAEANAERQLRGAEHATKALQGIIDGGSLPDDKTLSETQRAVAGTPYANVIKAMIAQGAERAAFGSLTPDQQQAQLVEYRGRLNQTGASEATLQRLRTFEGIAARSRDMVEKDALLWGVQSRLVGQPATLDFGNLQDLAHGLGGRIEQAQLVGAQLRRPVSPLFAHEAQRVGELLSALPLDQKKTAVRTLAHLLPPEQQRALAGQLNDQDNTLALALHAAAMPQQGGADVSELILRGADAVKSGRIKRAGDDGATNLDRARIAKDLNAVAWPTPKARDAAVQSAWLIYDGLRDAKGSGSRSEAMKLATGGGLADWGDAKVPVPPGWSEGRFRSVMRAMSAETLAQQAGGQLFIGSSAIEPAALVRALPKAALMPLGPGRYAIDAGGLVVDANRRPFVLRVGD